MNAVQHVDFDGKPAVGAEEVEGVEDERKGAAFRWRVKCERDHDGNADGDAGGELGERDGSGAHTAGKALGVGEGFAEEAGGFAEEVGGAGLGAVGADSMAGAAGEDIGLVLVAAENAARGFGAGTLDRRLTARVVGSHVKCANALVRRRNLHTARAKEAGGFGSCRRNNSKKYNVIVHGSKKVLCGGWLDLDGNFLNVSWILVF
jgi:hypothetical protein